MPTSPAGVCRECIGRTLAEDPRSAAHAEGAARILDKLSPALGDAARALVAVHVLCAFLERCRK